MKVTLHLGAHKTASTFLQKALVKNAAPLAAGQVRVVPLGELRAELTRKLAPRKTGLWTPAPLREAARYAQALLTAPGAERVVLSDENLLGDLPQMVQTATLYPQAAERLAGLAQILSGHDVEIFLAIRHLGHFSRSLYSENLRWMTGDFIDVAAFQAAWLSNQPSWLPVIATIQKAFPEAPLTLWNHDLIKHEPERILNLLTGEPGLSWDLDAVFKRRGMSHAAVETLMEIGREKGTKAMRGAVHEVHRSLLPGPDRPVFRMWDEAQMKDFAKRHRQDLAALAGASPPLRLVEPSG